MRRRNVWALEIIVVLIFFIPLASINIVYPDAFNKNGGWFAAVSIFAVVLTFLGTELIKEDDHEKSQVARLKVLRSKIADIEKMAISHRNTDVPFYLFSLPDESLYYHNLDYDILGKSTDDLKRCINRIQDKLQIINGMISKIQNSFDSFLISNNVKKTDVDHDGVVKENILQKFKQDKMFRFYRPKILEMLMEKDKDGFSYNLEKAKCILSERFGIN